MNSRNNEERRPSPSAYRPRTFPPPLPPRQQPRCRTIALSRREGDAYRIRQEPRTASRIHITRPRRHVTTRTLHHERAPPASFRSRPRPSSTCQPRTPHVRGQLTGTTPTPAGHVGLHWWIRHVAPRRSRSCRAAADQRWCRMTTGRAVR